MDWVWKGKSLKEIKEYRYLGYTTKCNGKQEAHINKRVRRGATSKIKE